jgi:hypothetical protein
MLDISKSKIERGLFVFWVNKNNNRYLFVNFNKDTWTDKLDNIKNEYMYLQNVERSLFLFYSDRIYHVNPDFEYHRRVIHFPVVKYKMLKAF